MTDIITFVLAYIGGSVILFLAVALIHSAAREAIAKEKRIEFGGFIVAIIAAVVSIGGFIYTVNTVDALEERVVGLEKTVQSMSKAAP
jgi:uncharacterized BrkB/YihY/UPF0761 family membrane protein